MNNRSGKCFFIKSSIQKQKANNPLPKCLLANLFNINAITPNINQLIKMCKTLEGSTNK